MLVYFSDEIYWYVDIENVQDGHVDVAYDGIGQHMYHTESMELVVDDRPDAIGIERFDNEGFICEHEGKAEEFLVAVEEVKEEYVEVVESDEIR